MARRPGASYMPRLVASAGCRSYQATGHGAPVRAGL